MLIVDALILSMPQAADAFDTLERMRRAQVHLHYPAAKPPSLSSTVHIGWLCQVCVRVPSYEPLEDPLHPPTHQPSPMWVLDGRLPMLLMPQLCWVPSS